MRIESTPGRPDPRMAAAARAIGLDPSEIIAGTIVYGEEGGQARVRWEQVRDLTPEQAEAFRRAWFEATT